jgi:hypothetical protein
MSEKREVEVFRIINFDKTIEYGYAYYTKKEGRYPNEKYYTTNEIKYAGKHKESVTLGNFGDGHGGYEVFINNKGEKTIVNYDYEGKLCFISYKEN